MNASEQNDRTVVEERIMEHIESIRSANKLTCVEATYNYVIENWYMFDAHWLEMVRHMKNNGRLK